jgi:hypothetical protein
MDEGQSLGLGRQKLRSPKARDPPVGSISSPVRNTGFRGVVKSSASAIHNPHLGGAFEKFST